MKHIKLDKYIEYPVGQNIVKNLPAIFDMADLILAEYSYQNIRLWCRGSSGAIIAGIISSIIISRSNFKVEVCHVKKEKEDSHSYQSIHFDSYNNYVEIIVDDFIASGKTVEAIIEKMNSYNIVPNCLCVTNGVPGDFGVETYICKNIEF